MPSRPPSDAGPAQRRRYAPRMSPSKRREQLIDAALRVIITHGYEGVSIEAIARTAGVTRPVIYDHFPNLGSLLRSADRARGGRGADAAGRGRPRAAEP